MSACVSRRGEYSSHEPDGDYVCTWCGVLDEEGLIAELNRARAEAAATRQRYAELERAARALFQQTPLGVLAMAAGSSAVAARMAWAADRDTRWLNLGAALAELDSPCTCPDIDVSTMATPPDVRDVVKGLEPTCPEHGKGMRRVDPPR